VATQLELQWQEFEKTGELTIRQHLAANYYGEDKTRAAEAWLEHKAQERAALESARIASTQSEQALAASRAATAAENEQLRKLRAPLTPQSGKPTQQIGQAERL
jgi:hypothetical protein